MDFVADINKALHASETSNKGLGAFKLACERLHEQYRASSKKMKVIFHMPVYVGQSFDNHPLTISKAIIVEFNNVRYDVKSLSTYIHLDRKPEGKADFIFKKYSLTATRASPAPIDGHEIALNYITPNLLASHTNCLLNVLYNATYAFFYMHQLDKKGQPMLMTYLEFNTSAPLGEHALNFAGKFPESIKEETIYQLPPDHNVLSTPKVVKLSAAEYKTLIHIAHHAIINPFEDFTIKWFTNANIRELPSMLTKTFLYETPNANCQQTLMAYYLAKKK